MAVECRRYCARKSRSRTGLEIHFLDEIIDARFANCHSCGSFVARQPESSMHLVSAQPAEQPKQVPVSVSGERAAPARAANLPIEYARQRVQALQLERQLERIAGHKWHR